MTYEVALTALSDPTRRLVFERILAAPRPVAAIAEGLPVSRPAVSQHLRVLKDVGLVHQSRDGTRRLYQVDPAGLAVLRTYLDQFWERSLTAFRQATETEVSSGDPGS